MRWLLSAFPSGIIDSSYSNVQSAPRSSPSTMSKLLASLHDFQSQFETFRVNRVRVGHIYRETHNAWIRCQDKIQDSEMRARSLDDSARSDEENVHQDPTDCFKRNMRDVARLLEEKPTLLFVGQLKSGKSTLANVILQHHILPTDEGPCTARMVKLKPLTDDGDSNAYLQVLSVGGNRIGERITLETTVDSRGLHRLVIPQNIVDVGHGTTSSFTERSGKFHDKGQKTEHGAWVEISYPHPLLDYIQIVDSPGKGENEYLDQLVNDEICNGLVQTLVYVINGCRGLTVQVSIV